MQLRLDDKQAQGKVGLWTGPCGFARVPDLTESKIEEAFSHLTLHPDEGVCQWSKDVLDLLLIGVCAATLYRNTQSQKQWNAIKHGTLAEMAGSLEDSLNNTTDRSVVKDQVDYALKYAKKSVIFKDLLPSNTGIMFLAEQFLTVNEATRNHLLVLAHIVAGLQAFRLVKMQHLTNGSTPILSVEALRILGCDKENKPNSMSQLLKQMKTCFDSDSISMDDKAILMDMLILISKQAKNLPDAKWTKIDETEVSGRKSSEAKKPYFVGTARVNKKRRDKASLALVVTVASKYIHKYTRDLVDDEEYDENDGFLSLLLRNSMNLFHDKAAKLKMAKVYDGNAPTEYMEGVKKDIEVLVGKASTGSGRGTGESVYDKDVTVLFHLIESPIDERLRVVGCDPDEDESSGEEAEEDDSSEADDGEGGEEKQEAI